MNNEETLYQKDPNCVWFSTNQQKCDGCEKKKDIVYDVMIEKFYNKKFCFECLVDFLPILYSKYNLEYIMLRSIFSPTKNKPRKRDTVGLSLRYKILKRDGFRCKCCGISASNSPIEIDHIIPVSAGGKTVESNLRSLCFNCNRGKSDG